MLELEVTVINRLGLHARAAAKLVKEGQKFESKITIENAQNSFVAPADSILSLLRLAAADGSRLTVRADGRDEEGAIDAMRTLFEDGFGETN